MFVPEKIYPIMPTILLLITPEIMETITGQLADTHLKKDKEWSKIIQLTRNIPTDILEKYVADLQDLFPEANTYDGINHNYRFHLPSLAEYDRLEVDTIFVALNPDKVVGLMVGFHEDANIDVTSVVHPKFRRQGVFKALLDALTAKVGQSIEISFEVCDQSTSGVGCAKHLGLTYEPKIDYYMECKKLTEPNKPLPSLTFKVVDETDVHLVAQIFEEEEKFNSKDEEIEFNPEDSMASEMKDGIEARVYFNQENDLIGMIQYVCRDEKTAPYILNFLVRPKYRSKGFGEAILRNIVSYWLDDRKRSPVELETPREIASYLYQKCGFEVKQSYNTWYGKK